MLFLRRHATLKRLDVAALPIGDWGTQENDLTNIVKLEVPVGFIGSAFKSSGVFLFSAAELRMTREADIRQEFAAMDADIKAIASLPVPNFRLKVVLPWSLALKWFLHALNTALPFADAQRPEAVATTVESITVSFTRFPGSLHATNDLEVMQSLANWLKMFPSLKHADVDPEWRPSPRHSQEYREATKTFFVRLLSDLECKVEFAV